MEDVGFDFLAKIKRGIGVFKPGGVYWCGSKHIRFDSYIADTFNTSIIPKFTNQKKLFIVRGGIGDLLALSVLHDAAQEVIVLTTKSLYPILDWWATTPKKKHFNEPIWMIKYPQKLEDVVKAYGQTSGDVAITLGSRENWYDITYRSVGYPQERIETMQRRPQLKRMEPDQPCRILEDSILIVHKATSVNRTADLESIANAIPDEFTGNVYFYDDKRRLRINGELVQQDPTSLRQYLSDLYYADFVISVDTSAIHFREGIEKPALGIYSSFSTESRTKYYQFTRSIDIESPCKSQPCFINFKPCHVARPNAIHAPCLGPVNPTFVKQLNSEICNYLKNGASAWLAMSNPSVMV